ncbi:MAG: nitroreductase family protein [Planctomycetota bacterium]|jgi:NAD-dependent dihydropyrimidine dehydrogenase PreA subunit|nr:nitroreductase family protein [Planctomycetota bacterium]
MSESSLPVSQFHVDPAKCTACGACVRDCPVGIIHIADGVAAVKPADDAECVGCQHCLAICPFAAVGVAGKKPEDSRPVGGCDPAVLDRLIRSRRSVRQFAPGVVEPALLRRVMETVAYAPTGVNIRDLLFTIVHDPKVMGALRQRVCEALVARAGQLPPDHAWLADLAKDWLDKKVDGIFRTAPHLIVVTAGSGQICKVPDCLIALSYFDLVAQANNIGTTWCGMMDGVLRCLPECRSWLGIPGDHELGYVMLFGPKGVDYARTAQYDLSGVTMVEKLV